ncbi:hypothetical protein V1478_016635, partial [Vespula squamosa]
AIEIIFGRFNEIRRTRQEAISSKLYRVEQVDAMEEMALNEISLVDNADTSCHESNITDHQRTPTRISNGFAFAMDEEEHLVAGLLHVWILTANNPLELYYQSDALIKTLGSTCQTATETLRNRAKNTSPTATIKFGYEADIRHDPSSRRDDDEENDVNVDVHDVCYVIAKSYSSTSRVQVAISSFKIARTRLIASSMAD